ncbi:hypothetical protein EMIT0180MI3_340008 [Priestia megaterium]
MELSILMAFYLSSHVQTFFIQVNILLVQISFMKGEHLFANQYSTDPHQYGTYSTGCFKTKFRYATVPRCIQRNSNTCPYTSGSYQFTLLYLF